jgi:hypothetical protein
MRTLPDEQPSPEQIEIYRRMTPEQRYQAGRDLYWSARRMKAAFLQHLHPDWTTDQIETEVRRIFLYAQS